MKNFKNKKKIIILLSLLVVVSLFVGVISSNSELEQGSISYTTFMSDLDAGLVDSVILNKGSLKLKVVYKEGLGQEEVYDSKTNELKELTIEDNKRIESVINPADDAFFKTISEKGAEVLINNEKGSAFLLAILSQVPSIILLFVLLWYIPKMLGGINPKNKSLSVKATEKFEDVAGMTEEKEELMFAINSLQNKEAYIEKGVQPIRGILLEGPPGVGKTLLAKAVAGEAGVNFLSYSGSDFVEMYVGLGAKRIRTMYEEAEKLKPCVVFIDELDALGKKRTFGSNGAAQESDQTLIALLERMDGMNSTSGILFIAATNRVDSLDSALLRPGRFDKTIHVGLPKTKEDREAIVKVHSKNKTFADDTSIAKIAKQCYGLTGAEIASALNDSVLESFKANRSGVVNLDDIDKAIMKLFAKGLAKGRHNEADLYRVSVHEIGHALMNIYFGRSIVKVSIQPYSSGIGGVTIIDGEASQMDGLRTKTDLINDIKVLYAGKVAEEVIFGECSIGASNDLERATFILRDFIGAYGMNNDNLLSLVGLGKENLMVTANSRLLKAMEETAINIYKEVSDYFNQDFVKEELERLANLLSVQEVIYDLESVLLSKGECYES